MIEFEGVEKSYGRNQVLQNINLKFDSGQVVGLIGPNGSGKTTLIKILLGHVLNESGKVEFASRPVRGESLFRKEIGYMPQINRYPDHMTVKQLFSLMRRVRKDVPLSQQDLELFEVYEVEKMYPKRLNNLSGGMRQKISAALAFLFNPKALILDEPTAGLDPVSNEILKDKLTKTAEDNRLILITSHILSDLDDITTDVAYMLDGHVLFYQSFEELKQETQETRLNKVIAQKLKKEKADA